MRTMISLVLLFRIKQTAKICKCIANSVCRAGYEDNKQHKQGKKSEGAKDESEKRVCG